MDKDITLPMSFVGKTGFFYVLRNEGLTIARKYALYTSPESYNLRNEVPLYVDAKDALADFDHELFIYPESLTTTPPVYPTDRDESDLGLTPQQNIWRTRFKRAKEGQFYEI